MNKNYVVLIFLMLFGILMFMFGYAIHFSETHQIDYNANRACEIRLRSIENLTIGFGYMGIVVGSFAIFMSIGVIIILTLDEELKRRDKECMGQRMHNTCRNWRR